jgi:hypothetical protein
MDDRQPAKPDPTDLLQVTPDDIGLAGETAAARVEDATEAEVYRATHTGAWWTIPSICLGLAMIAACVLIPAADDNRRIAYEKQQLDRDLGHIEKQLEMNRGFLRGLESDPTLAERLARRQMKVLREGSRTLDIGEKRDSFAMSPYALLNVPPPPELPPYQPIGGRLSELCRDGKSRLYILGGSVFLVALGLIMGGPGTRPLPQSPLTADER